MVEGRLAIPTSSVCRFDAAVVLEPRQPSEVSTIPGSITVTLMSVSATAWRSASPMAVTANLVAEYSEPGSARRPAIDLVSRRSTW
jgi:hypothetical protein